MKDNFKTQQEKFWFKNFGNQYIERNTKSNNSNLYKYLENSYKLLIRLRIVKKIELKYLRAWIKDIKIRLI